MDKKVSIITPCLNGERFVSRYLESVLAQTYSNIELIFINDGSTDKTEEIVLSYVSKFTQKGMKLIYIYQNNAGQAVALNKGLKVFSGEYLTWPDSDDILAKNSVENKVKYLEENLSYGFVRSYAEVVDECNLNRVRYLLLKEQLSSFREDIFHDLITEKISVCSGCYMVRTSAFLSVNPNKEIINSSAGQNWQILIPLAYKYKCGYIDEPLYRYVVRSNSHSHQDENINLETNLRKYSIHEKLLNDIISILDVNRTYYYNLIRKKYIRRKLELAIRYKNKALAKEQYLILQDLNQINLFDKITYFRTLSSLFDMTYKITNIPMRVVRKIKAGF